MRKVKMKLLFDNIIFVDLSVFLVFEVIIWGKKYIILVLLDIVYRYLDFVS